MTNSDDVIDPLDGVPEAIILGLLVAALQAPSSISTENWAKAERVLSSEVSPIPGAYNPLITPYMRLVMKKLDDPNIRIVVGLKSAQIAWTEVINNYFGRRIANDPCNIIVAFPTRGAGTSFSAEKFKPYIKSTPALYNAIGNPERHPWDRVSFPGGFIKFVTAGSISNLKSTNAAVVTVEEPDDLKEDVNQQGDALTILKERLKAHPDSKLIFGGTPANEGSSKVTEAYEASCQYRFQTRCHSCGEFHELHFDNLKVDAYGAHKYHKTYGEFDPSTARYECPNCGSVWTDKEKNANVLNSINYFEDGWRADFPDVPEVGFAFNELLSPFAGSTFKALAKKRCTAYTDYYRGNDKKLKSWVNNSEGRAYSPPQDDLKLDTLKEKALAYPLGVIPKGGVVLTAGVDIQHNRFHLIIRAYGAKNCSWLIRREELFGNVLDPSDPVWDALRDSLLAQYPIEGYPTIKLGVSAASIDTSDGTTSEIAYQFVNRMNALGLKTMACKGSSERSTTNEEIFKQPTNTLETMKNKVKSLAETMGVNVYIVGSNRAKDTILRQLKQIGEYDRLYYPQAINPAYYDQMLSNVKYQEGRKFRYKLLSGRRDEDLDCEGLCHHASRALYVHIKLEQDWETEYLLLTKQGDKQKIAPAPVQVAVTKGLGLSQRG